jgi:hypothetical protein
MEIVSDYFESLNFKFTSLSENNKYLEEFPDIEAFDLINSEDVLIKEYLKNRENIIIVLNNKYHAFSRKDFIKTINLQNKKFILNYHGIYTTFYYSPWNHLLNEECINDIRFFDYSFYKIEKSDLNVCIDYENSEYVPLFMFKCYSVKKFYRKFLSI